VKSEWIGPAVLIGGAVYLWYVASGIEPGFARTEVIGPAFFPKLLLAGLILVSLLQLARAGVARLRDVDSARAATKGEASPAKRFYLLDLLLALFLTAGYVALLRRIGFLPATLLFQGALIFFVFRQRTLKFCAGVPALLTVIYFVIFIRLMEMPLPQGQGIFRELSQFLYYF